jgi:hypothetical protein
LTGEVAEEAKRTAEEDLRKAEEGLVALLLESGELRHKRADELVPENLSARMEAEDAEAARVLGLLKDAACRAPRIPVVLRPASDQPC